MKQFIYLTILFSFLACSSQWDAHQLLGEWETTAWKIINSNKKINAKMDFKFGADNRYELDYGSRIEKGKYWIFGDYLHTVEDGKSEKKVKITSLTKDHFIFEMNRAGTIEQVILEKI